MPWHGSPSLSRASCMHACMPWPPCSHVVKRVGARASVCTPPMLCCCAVTLAHMLQPVRAVRTGLELPCGQAVALSIALDIGEALQEVATFQEVGSSALKVLLASGAFAS